MPCRFPLALLAAAAALLLFAVAAPCRAQSDRPSVLLIVADDLGYSDLACYGSEIATPNLDTLARDGLRFTQFYNTARCWPSRAAILTGHYAQEVRRDEVPGIASGNGGKRPLWARLLPDLLRPLGYRSYHSGKWHIDSTPIAAGFDRSYSLNDHDRHFAPRLHTLDDAPLAPVRPGTRYYSTTAIADHAIGFLREHHRKYTERPFFCFVAFTAPHFPVQAPASDIARYRSRYLPGWDAMRDQRWSRMQRLGIGGSELSPIERQLGPPYAFPEAMQALGPLEVNLPLPWETLTPEQHAFQAAKMAVHAAMVDRMDREIGRILAQLRAMHADKNTLVCFLSDNGASAEIMVRGDGHDPHAACGTGATFLSIGPGWSSMCNTPFRRHKTWVHEGGISTPFLVRWPAGFRAAGELRHTPAHIIDIVPTILEIAGGKAPEQWRGQPAPPMPGRSLVPAFQGDVTIARDCLWWLHEGNRALRMENYKIVSAGAGAPWELYDMRSDRSETHDLAALMPERVKAMSAQWEQMTERLFTTARTSR